jgi:hypothetical protein
VQAVVRKYAQFKGTGKVTTTFLRHYYDIHQLLDVEARAEFHWNSTILGTQKEAFQVFGPRRRKERSLYD